MALSNSRCAWVNKSTSNIPVYDGWQASSAHVGGQTVGGNKIGEIYPNEFYTLIPNPTPNFTSYIIIFQDPNKVERKGNIETSYGTTLGNYAWVSGQEPYHYFNSNGTTLVASATETISGTTYRIFTVYGTARNYKDSGGTDRGTLAVGTKLATLESTTGVTYGGYMLFYKKKVGTGAWTDLVSGGSSTYGFVDLGLNIGSFPNNRTIR